MCLFGDLHEKMNSGKAPKDVNWTPFIYGGMCGAVTWLVLYGEIARDPNKDQYPWYAWAYIIVY